MNTTDFARLLGAIRDHLTTFDLPYEIASIQASIDYLDGERIVVHLCGHQLPGLTTALLAWADTLTNITATAWRVPAGERVHLTVAGQLVDHLTVQIYGGVPFNTETFGPDLQPNGKQSVSLGVLRGWATGSGVAA